MAFSTSRTSTVRLRPPRFAGGPLGIGEVARVAQARTIMGLALLHGPHRASPPYPISSTRGKRPGRGELTRLRRAGADPTFSGHVSSREDPPFKPAAR